MPEQAPSVAADLLASVATDETYPPEIRSAAAQLALIGRAMGNGATWAVIGRTLGISGREAKKRAHGLREKVKRAVAGRPENRSEEEVTPPPSLPRAQP